MAKSSLWIALTASAVLISGMASAQAPRPVDNARLTHADREPGQWMSVGRTYGEERFSPLNQINRASVKDLGLAWYADLGSTRGLEASPLMVDGVLYDTQPWNITTAFDAKTGKLLWRYDPKVPQQSARQSCCDIITRGLAAWKGKIYVATLDGRLIALDAKTGTPVWSVNTFDDNVPWAMVMTGAPRVFDGKVIIGNAGGEAAARGYITAYDAETGKKDWRFYVVPGDPAKPATGPQAKADKISAPTWTGDWWKVGGGGGDWDTLVYDPKAKLVYIGTGNGGPYSQHFRSPQGGDNLFTSSIVALHVETGEYAWHYQEVPGDSWDYDATAPLMLTDLKMGGRLRHVIMHAPKDGFFYVLDRLSGKVLSAKNYVPVNWTSGLDKNFKPVVRPEARYGEHPFMVTPNLGGSHNWQPMAYSPQTGLVYFPVTVNYGIFAYNPDFKQQPGNVISSGSHYTSYPEERKALLTSQPKSESWLMAYDPIRQKEAWRVAYPRNGSGGVLATAGGLVFEGTINATFAAYDAKTGAKVWDMPVQQVPIAAPIAYRIDGEQYIAVNAGYAGSAHQAATNDSLLQISDYGRLLVFKLGGDAKLPKVVASKVVLEEPPPLNGSRDEVRLGGEIYGAHCSSCHGEEARGGVKDLRRMSSQTHASFNDIVLGGARKDRGMASFGDILSKTDADNLHKYIVARINEDWADLKSGK